MAAPAIGTAASTSSPSLNSLTITKPTSLAAGDLFGCSFWTFGNAATTVDTPASGFVAVQTASFNDGGDQQRLALYLKIADSSDAAAANFTFARTMGTPFGAQGTLFRIASGTYGVPHLDGTPTTTSTASGTTGNFASITTTGPDELIIICGAGYALVANSAASWATAAPSGYAIPSGGGTNDGTNFIYGGVASKALAASGASGAATVPFSGGIDTRFITITAAIRSPAARAFRRRLFYPER